MATDKKKFARPSDSMVAQLKDMIQKYGPKAKVYDPDALEAARAAVKEPQNYGADEFRIIMADLKAAAAQNFAVEDRFYFGKGRKERFADDIYLDFPNARFIANELQKVIGSMKPMGESRMDAAIVQALGQLQKISATLQQPKFVSISTLKAMMRQVDGLAKKFKGLSNKYWDEREKFLDKSSALRKKLPGPGKPFPLGSRESREYTSTSRELRESQKNSENLVVLIKEAWRIEAALAPIAKRWG